MRKIISSRYTYYKDFFKNDNCKRYRAQGIDHPYVPNEEWMTEIGNEYYMIWAPQTNRRTKMEVAKCIISRGDYGVPAVYGRYLDKPFKDACWDNYFPRYCWSDAYEFMGIPEPDDTRCDCLVFDNEQEAREFCNEYNEWKEKKKKKRVKDYLNSDEVKKEFKEYLEKIKNVINDIDENDSEHYYEMIKDLYLNNYKIFSK